MKNRIIISNIIATLLEINIVLLLVFISGNTLNLFQASWWLCSLFLLNVYVFLSIKLFYFGNKTECFVVNKKALWGNNICLILLSALFYIATLAIAVENTYIKYILWGIIAVVLLVEYIFRILYTKKIFSLKIVEKNNFDFTSISNERIKCTEEDVSNYSFCLGILIVISFLLFIPMIAVGFENLVILVIGSTIASLICNLLLLISNIYVNKMIPSMRRNIVISYINVTLNQICCVVLTYLIFVGMDDILRGGIFLFIILSFIEMYLILIGPIAKQIAAMKAYLQNQHKK